MPAAKLLDSPAPPSRTKRTPPAMSQLELFENNPPSTTGAILDIKGETSNFVDNMRLPVHRWFRYSAGFSAEWVKSVLAERTRAPQRVLDPFVGSGTT